MKGDGETSSHSPAAEQPRVRVWTSGPDVGETLGLAWVGTFSGAAIITRKPCSELRKLGIFAIPPV